MAIYLAMGIYQQRSCSSEPLTNATISAISLVYRSTSQPLVLPPPLLVLPPPPLLLALVHPLLPPSLVLSYHASTFRVAFATIHLLVVSCCRIHFLSYRVVAFATIHILSCDIASFLSCLRGLVTLRLVFSYPLFSYLLSPESRCCRVTCV